VSRALTEAFAAATGRPPRGSFDALWAELRVEKIVASRSGAGTCAPAAVREMGAALRDRCAALRDAVDTTVAAAEFPARLRRSVAEKLGREW
jgi:hypothetical protein